MPVPCYALIYGSQCTVQPVLSYSDASDTLDPGPAIFGEVRPVLVEGRRAVCNFLGPQPVSFDQNITA